jgi:hypothetical protein
MFGLIEVGVGVLTAVAGDRWPLGAGGWSLRKKLATWHVSPPEAGADLERQIREYYRSLYTITLVVTGLVAVLVGAALVLLAHVGHPLSAAAAAAGASLAPILIIYLYSAQVVGTGLGYSLAVRLARRFDDTGPRYADLRRRRLADYRAPGLRWLAVGAVAVQVAAGLAFGLLRGTWSALAIPAVMALAVAVAELQMSAAARVPRMVVTANPAVARRCDDLVRSGVIARLQQLLLLSLAFACFLQELIILGLARTPDGPLRYAGVLTLVTAAYCAFAAIGLSGLDERLGGRITGWWGRPMPE